MGILDDIARTRAAIAQTKARPPLQPGQLYVSPYATPTPYWGAQIPTYPMNFPGWPDLQQPGDRRALTDEERAKVATATSWVFADVQAIARELSVAIPRVVRVKGEEELEQDDHPLERIISSPNPFMGRSFVLQYWTWQLLLFGKAYLYFAPTSSRLAELWPVPSLRLTPHRDPDQYIDYYEYRSHPSATPLRVDPRYVVYTRLPHPFDPYDGLSPIAAMWLAIEADTSQAAWNADFFGKENAIPSAVVSTRPDITNSDFLRFRTELLEFFGSGKRRTLIARGGEVDVKLLQFNPEELQFEKLRYLNREQIDRVLGFPEGYWSADATRANSDHARATLIGNTVWPMLTLLAEDLTAQHARRWYGDDIRAGWTDIRPENIELRIKQQASRKDYWLVNELRREDGLDPLPPADPRSLLTVAELRAHKHIDILLDRLRPKPATAPAALTEADEALPPSPEEEAQPDPDEAVIEGEYTVEDNAEAQAAAVALLGAAWLTLPVTTSSAEDLARWERKALSRLRAGKRPACHFDSAAIPSSMQVAIKMRLEAAETAAEVRAAFATTRAEYAEQVGEEADGQ